MEEARQVPAQPMRPRCCPSGGEAPPGVSRRDFLAIAGSAALVGLSVSPLTCGVNYLSDCLCEQCMYKCIHLSPLSRKKVCGVHMRVFVEVRVEVRVQVCEPLSVSLSLNWR